MENWVFATLPALTLIMGLGEVFGRIKLPGNFRLGVAAVFFVGVGFGVIYPDLKIHHDIERFGLALFVYCVGLTAAPAFFQSLKRNGLMLNFVTFLAMTMIFFCSVGVIKFFGKDSMVMSGLFCGTLTNTPSLNAAKEAKRLITKNEIDKYIKENGLENEEANRYRNEQNELVEQELKKVDAGYGVAYPFAIVGVLLILQFHLMREKKRAANKPQTPSYLVSVVELCKEPPGNYRCWTGALINRHAHVIASRYRFNGEHHFIDGSTMIPMGAMVVIEGAATAVQAAEKTLGKQGELNLIQERDHFSTRFFTVSGRYLINQSVWRLKLGQFGASICRIKRGDTRIEINPRTRLQLGDLVRVIIKKDKQEMFNKFFGNSMNRATEQTFFSLFIGVALGLLIGQIPIPIPGVDVPVTLGYAGGPLVVALFFGAVGRSGPFVWSIAPGTNMALRHVGFALFLAVIGVNSGSKLLSTLRGDGCFLILICLAMLILVHLIIWVVLLLCCVPNIPTLLGVMSGFQTQPMAMEFAASRSDATTVNVGNASVYPLATILKIFYAQLLIVMFL